MTDKYPNVVPMAATEDSFGAFTEHEIDIPNSFITRTAMLVHQIEMLIPFPEDSPSTDAQETVTVSLHTQPRADHGRITDDYCIGYWRNTVRAGVAVYLPLMFSQAEGLPSVYKFPDDKPLIIVAQKLYLYIQSTNSSAAAYAHGRLLCTFKTLTEKEWREAFEVWAPTG